MDKESKRELHDSGRSSPCEDHSSSNGRVIEVKVTVQEEQADQQHRSSVKKQRKVTTSTTTANARTPSRSKGMNAHEGKPALSREAERRAAVLERRRKQEEELKAKMEQLRIRQEARLNRAAATMQMDPAVRRAQLLGKQPAKSATNPAPKPSPTAKSLPIRIQQAVERLSVPKYRREDNQIANSSRMAQSMNNAALVSHLKAAKHVPPSPARRENVMSLSFSSRVEQTRKRAKSHADKPSGKSSKDADEMEYKRKLEEKRRIAREKQEKERQRQEQERLKREEEEQKAQLERIRQQEEALKLEEETLKKAIEEKEKADAALREKEEKERQMKAEEERRHVEETKRLEAERQARLLQEEEERQMRRKKINDILSSHRSPVTSDRQSLLTSATESVNLFFNNELISNTTSQVLQTYFNRPRPTDLPPSDAESKDFTRSTDIESEEQPCLVNGKHPESNGETSG